MEKQRHTNQNRTKGQEGISLDNVPLPYNIQCPSWHRHNAVSLNLDILKNHVIQQEGFGYGYLVASIDLAIDLLISSRQGMALPVPMELMKICSIADERLKNRKLPKARPDKMKYYIRIYVQLWTRLYQYIKKCFDDVMAEHILLEAYYSMWSKEHQQVPQKNVW